MGHAARPLGVLFAVCVAAAEAQTAWPAFLDNLSWVPAKSPYAADLPEDTKIIPPTEDIPPNRASWSGVWRGWACPDAVCDTRLAVEEVRADGAQIIYAFASQATKASQSRNQATFVNDELTATLRNGAVISYRKRKDGNLDFLYQRGNQMVAGILKRER